MGKLPGISREDEEAHLQEIFRIAEGKVHAMKENVQALADELHEMLDVFDESDKEALAMWHNTDARFKQVNQELQIAQQARKKPYFGRIDFMDRQIKKEECYYIGRSVIAEDPAYPRVIDWRAPIAGVYYDSALGEVTYQVKGEGSYEILLSRKRTYEIADDRLKDFYDSDVVANDELLTKYLAKNKTAVLGEIIATIQKEQNEAIRKKPQHNMIIQGAAGSGKTTVAMHRISYILYNYELEFAPQDFYIIGSNQVLLRYITGMLPQLNVYGVRQMTMEELFVRLLYEEWDAKKYRICPVKQGVTPPDKGTLSWFRDLERFCDAYEETLIPRTDVVIEKTGKVLLTAEAIAKILQESRHLSRAEKVKKLTEHLIAKLENEITGKYYSYTAEEKKRLLRYYETYFGAVEWKGSIYERYDAFLRGQMQKTEGITLPGECFDVYDLAALAYLYKRLKETEIIREAGHVVIDEAQDFGMMIYSSLKYCLTKCTYTIMGDVAQNISAEYGLNDWQQLRELMLPGAFDFFGLLQKSYRNTVEIADFATQILHHGSFPVYPVQPIIRHGSAVEKTACGSFEELVEQTAAYIKAWQADGKETIAVICVDEEQARRVSERLSGQVPLVSLDPENLEFRTGVMVLALEYTKGLEFDGVVLFDASEENYPVTDRFVKRLYVGATRALHVLAVCYQGKLTKLIAQQAAPEKRRQAITESSAPVRPAPVKEPEQTKAEIYAQQAIAGAKEMDERGAIGPRRIVTGQEKLPESGRKRVKIDSGSATLPSYLERRKQELQKENPKPDTGEFGEMPDSSELAPAGHARIDCGIKLCMKGSGYVDLVSAYGTLRIEPMRQDVVRIAFGKGTAAIPQAKGEFEKQKLSCRFRETRETVELLTEKLLVKVDKKSGAAGFYKPGGKLLLTEQQGLPRQIGDGRSWLYFNWEKKESLLARGASDESFLPIGRSAKYISFGREDNRLPALSSDRGYELYLPAGQKVLCCNVSMYGTYLRTEGGEGTAYYFKVR